MAYAADPTQQDPNAPAANTQTPANQPVSTGSSVGGGASSSKSGNQASSAVAPAPFTNLQSYLNVNAPQIQDTANTVAGQLGNSYNTAKGAVDTAGANFAGQVASGYAAPDQGVVNQAAANPTQFANDPNNVAAFQKQYNDKYSGPASFEGSDQYGSAQNAAQQAVNTAQNLGNYSGLQSYLTSNVESNPTQAMSALDASLINQNPNATQTIQSAAQPLGTLNDYLTSATGKADTSVSNAQNAAQQAAQFAQNKFMGTGGVIPTFQNDLTSRLGAASTSASTAANQAKADLASGKLTPDDLKLLGLDQGQFNEIASSAGALAKDYGQNFDLSNYATIQNPGTVFANPNAIATNQDYATGSALSKLTGTDLSQYLDQSLAGNAGKQNNSLVGFNAQGAGSDVSSLLNQSDTAALNSALTAGGQFFGGSNQGLTTADLSNPAVANSLTNYLQQKGDTKTLDALGRYLLTIGGPTAPPTQPTVVAPGQPKTPIGIGNTAPGIY